MTTKKQKPRNADRIFCHQDHHADRRHLYQLMSRNALKPRSPTCRISKFTNLNYRRVTGGLHAGVAQDADTTQLLTGIICD